LKFFNHRVYVKHHSVIGLFDAIYSGNEEKAHRLILKNMKQAFGENDETALHAASSKGLFSVVQRLVELFPDSVNIRNKDHQTAFDLAYEKGNSNVFCYLAEKGADLSSMIDLEGLNDVHKMVMRSDLLGLQGMVLKNEPLWGKSDKEKRTALHYAVMCGNVKAFYILTSHSYCPINSDDSKNRNPMHFAVYFNQINIVKLILRKRGSVDNYDHFYESPKSLALKFNHSEIWDLMQNSAQDFENFAEEINGTVMAELDHQREIALKGI
jgi:ankyrin repeat protein